MTEILTAIFAIQVPGGVSSMTLPRIQIVARSKILLAAILNLLLGSTYVLEKISRSQLPLNLYFPNTVLCELS